MQVRCIINKATYNKHIVKQSNTINAGPLYYQQSNLQQTHSQQSDTINAGPLYYQQSNLQQTHSQQSDTINASPLYYQQSNLLMRRSFWVRVRIQHRVIFSFEVITFTGTLHWTGNRRLITGVGSNPKVVTFSLLGNQFHLLFWNCKCTEETSYKG